MPTWIALFVAAGAAFGSSPDPKELLRLSAQANWRTAELAREYTFLERFEERELDKRGAVKKVEVKTFEVLFLDGSRYQRLVARDDQPLPLAEDRKQQEKLDKEFAKRSREDDRARAKRRAKDDKRRREMQEFASEVAEAFDLRIEGEGTIDGRDVWIVAGTPRQGYRPPNLRAKILPKVNGRIWIEKAGYHWVKLEAEVIDTVSFGLFLFRLLPGAHIEVEQRFVNGELWLPREVRVGGTARLGLVKKMHNEAIITFDRYRKFQTDTRILSVDETQ